MERLVSDAVYAPAMTRQENPVSCRFLVENRRIPSRVPAGHERYRCNIRVHVSICPIPFLLFQGLHIRADVPISEAGRGAIIVSYRMRNHPTQNIFYDQCEWTSRRQSG